MLSGVILVKPLEAKILEEHEKPLESFCIITLNNSKVKGNHSKNTGKYPIWEDAITIRPGNETSCLLELLYKDSEAPESIVGQTSIDLKEVEEHGKLSKWYGLSNQGKSTGEVFLEIVFSPGEFPSDNVLLSEASKIALHYHHSHASGRIRGDEDPLPEEDEK